MNSIDLNSLYISLHQHPSEAKTFVKFCEQPRFFPPAAVVHIHGIWTSAHEVFSLLWVRPDLRIIISELDPKGFTALQGKLSNPETCSEIRVIWKLLLPVLSNTRQDFSTVLTRFKYLIRKNVRFIPNATIRHLSPSNQRNPDTQQAMTTLENFPLLLKLLHQHEVPKAHVIFAHAVQLNPYLIAKVHLKKSGVMFYSVHTRDHFDWQGSSAQYAFEERKFLNYPAALLFNHHVSSFWTDQTVYMCHLPC